LLSHIIITVETNAYAAMAMQTSTGADHAVSKNKTDDEIGPSTVTLSRSEGSVALGVEMLRCAQHDNAPPDYYAYDILVQEKYL